MKTVKALVAFSNGVISMEQYEVRSLPTDMANDLIAAGICVEAGGGSGGGVLVVTDTNGTLDKTWQEIHDALMSGGAVIEINGTNKRGVSSVTNADFDLRSGTYDVSGGATYSANIADGYPARAV